MCVHISLQLAPTSAGLGLACCVEKMGWVVVWVVVWVVAAGYVTALRCVTMECVRGV